MLKSNIKNLIKVATPNQLLIHKLSHCKKKSLLFTFDDGPDEKITPDILTILDKYRIRSIFFVIGRFAEEHPDLVRKIYESGHLLGNHTYYHHNDYVPKASDYFKDVEKCQEIIKRLTGDYPLFFRPPQGIISLKSICVCSFLSLTTILWSLEGREWTKNKMQSPEVIANSILEGLNGDDIVLLHDNNFKSPKVLEIIIKNLKSKPFDFCTGIDNLIAASKQSNHS